MRIETGNNNLKVVRLQKIKSITAQLSIVAVSVCALYAVLFYFIHIPLLFYFSLAASVFAATSRIALQKDYFSYARFSLIIIGNIFVFCLCGSLGRETNINLLYFPLSCAILILFNLKETRFIISSLIITFTCIVILEIRDYHIFAIERPPELFIKFTRIFSEIFSLLILLVCIFSMQSAADSAETTLSEAQEEIELHARKMESKNKELEQFTFIASHDLREPLRTVNSLTDLLTENYGDKFDETARQSFNFINEATGRMNLLINGLLDYSRLGQNSEMEDFDLNSVLNEVCDDLSASLNSAEAEVKIEPMPKIHGYKTEIRLLFQNLISNAIKFRKPGILPRIIINAELKNEYWKFSVKDNGIGINPQYLDKIFIIFQRLHKRGTYEGSGIGLSHCKKIVELHNGKIWAESEPNEGSTFYFTIKIQ
jgi:signal transduction histidine kinase